MFTSLIIYFQPHRMRTDGGGGAGGGGRHKKRVRVPHNTCERQRQLAVGHGETLMPHNVQYRTPHSMDPRYADDGLVGTNFFGNLFLAFFLKLN